MDRQSRRRLLQSTLTLASLGLFSACGALLPQEQSPKVARLGWLMPNALNSPPDADITRGFQQGLQELGYVEGQNLVIEYRAAEGNFDRLPGLAAELARL